MEKYKELVTNKEKLFDIFENDKVKREEKEIDWGVQMGRMEEIYLEDMKSERKMTCGGGSSTTLSSALAAPGPSW